MIRRESKVTDKEAQVPRRDWRERTGASLKVVCLGYALFLFLLLPTIKLVGERFWLFSLVLLISPQIFLLPLFALFPPVVVFRRRLVWILLLSALFVLFGYMNWRWSIERTPASDRTLSILSNNIGQRKTRTMWPFLRTENPDIFALQEAWNHQRAISSENPGFYVAAHGEFLLASRYEIIDSGFVPNIRSRTGPVAAWFEIDFQGHPVIIYNVHMPTPRNDVLRLRGAGFLFEIARLGGVYSREGRATFKASLQARNQLAIDFLAHLKNEKRPFIVVGDFNMTDLGYLHRLYSRELTDVFAERGKGYGHTFPGISRNPITLFSSWLRIDYIFTDPNWRPLYCRTEPRQPAQHLSVAAQLEFSESK